MKALKQKAKRHLKKGIKAVVQSTPLCSEKHVLGATTVIGLQLMSVGAHADAICAQHGADDSSGFDSCWYLGAGVGLSYVDPDGESADGWRTSDSTDAGFNVFVGRHLTPHWFAELSYTDLGAATLENSNANVQGNPEFSYKTPALHLGYWLFDPQNTWNIYGKAGLAAIQNDVDDPRVTYAKETGVQFATGAGLQFQFKDRWFARLGLDFFDVDATYGGIMVGTYLGKHKHDLVHTKPEPEVFTEVPLPTPMPIMEETIVESAPELECWSYEGEMPTIYFDTDSSTLNWESKEKLDRVAEDLQQNTLLTIGIYGYADSRGSESYNRDLSERRVKAVANYLLSLGISEVQFMHEARGEQNPVLSGSGSEDLNLSRRVELILLNNPEQCSRAN